jgi:ABC-type Fe3+-hydroxamate transport system substrate-binding protein
MRKHRRILALFFSLCLLLSACRSSPVLVQEVHVQEAEDQTQDQELSPEDQGQEDEQFQNEEREDLDTQRDTENNEGITRDVGEADQAVDVDHGSTNLESHDTPTQASGGTGETVAPAQTTTAQQPQQSETPTVSQQPDTGTASTGGELAPTEPSQEPEPAITYRQIVDATGDYVDIPENLSTCTAVGVAAQLALMLGGSEALVGADENVLYSSIAGLLGVSANVWWSGNGTAGISDDCFSALLAAKPDACFVISGQNTFSEGQTQQLKDAGIAVVMLYALSSIDSLGYNAQIMGEAFRNTDKASRYAAWVSDLLSQVSSATSGTDAFTSSLYLCGWDYGASYQALGRDGYGVAYAYTANKLQLMSALMERAGVVNTSTDAYSAGRNTSDYVYVMPRTNGSGGWVSGSLGILNVGNLESKYDRYVTRVTGTGRIQLGDPLYRWVLVDSQDTKSQLEESVFWQYDPNIDSNGYVYIDGNKTYQSIIGSYDIYVVPQGQFGCDLAEASVESALEAWWVAAKLLGTYSLGEVQEKTSAFYQEFYGITLSDGVLQTMFGE